jgi:putative phage-type endonuclease
MQPVVLAKTKDMPREEWLQWRKKGIGGSDVAAIAGLSKYKSPVGVWLEKTGQLEPEEAGEAAYFGNLLEPIVAHVFAERTGKRVRNKHAMLQHSKYPWMIANLDREVVGEKAFLECKTASEYLKKDWEEEKIPDAYMLQIQHYLAVTNLPFCYIAAIIGGNKFQYKPVERDNELIDYIVTIEHDFWQMVQNGTPPEVDGTEASIELLKRLFPHSDGNEILLPDDAETLLRQYDEAKENMEHWETRKAEAENKIKLLMETSEIAILGERKISWKSVTSNRFDSTSFKKAYPDLYTQFAKPSESRRFTIK